MIMVFNGSEIRAINDSDVNAEAASKVRPVDLAAMTKNAKVATGAEHSILFAKQVLTLSDQGGVSP